MGLCRNCRIRAATASDTSFPRCGYRRCHSVFDNKILDRAHVGADRQVHNLGVPRGPLWRANPECHLTPRVRGIIRGGWTGCFGRCTLLLSPPA
jgi:hypothetical protein